MSEVNFSPAETLKRETNLLVLNHKAYSLDIWYVAWPSRPLPTWQDCSNYALGVKNGLGPGGHMFYIGLYRENMKQTTLGPLDIFWTLNIILII